MANGTEDSPVTTGWMSDVQRAIALILIVTFAIITIAPTIVLVFTGESDALVDMAKTLQAALVNMALIALGFFFGSNMSKLIADAGQQKIVEKLTSSAPPATGPVAPVPAQVVTVTAWWGLIDPAKQAAIEADPEFSNFVIAAKSGKATPAELDRLVAKGLLTRAEADVLLAS